MPNKELPILQAIEYLADKLEEESKELRLSKDIARYQQNPVAFCDEVLGTELWDKQQEVVESVRDNPRTSVRSCHSAGKSFVASCVVLWFLNTFIPSTVITTAPTDRQVRGILWKEIATRYHAARTPLGGKLLTTYLDMSKTRKWFAMGFTSREYEPDKFQGFHNENILIVVDEASGVNKNIYDGIEGLMASGNARLLLIGNPIDQATEFGDSFKPNSGYNKIHISAYDTPNLKQGRMVYPFLVSPTWVENRKQIWGENSPLFQVRVLGNFPDQSDDSLIPISWVERAVDREVPDGGESVIGFDVARFGDDSSVATLRRGQRVEAIYTWSKQDTMYSVGRLKNMMEELSVGVSNIDEGGLGAGPVDRLREQGANVKGVNFGMSANRKEAYLNIRAEMYWNLRELFRNDAISIPDDETLMDELTKIKYTYTSSGKIKLEDKDETKRRIGRSPDKADSLALAFMQPLSSTETIGTVGSLFNQTRPTDNIIEVVRGKIENAVDPYCICAHCGKKAAIEVKKGLIRCFNCGVDVNYQGDIVGMRTPLRKAFDDVAWRNKE